ncbi:hypothetical protein BDZ91DRAFT_515114 [Kalaharituber pfeilii]|nr:hypothetical protein BDZ91DRAFT_515114 [Kalaharituber pfeilii]
MANDSPGGTAALDTTPPEAQIASPVDDRKETDELAEICRASVDGALTVISVPSSAPADNQCAPQASAIDTSKRGIEDPKKSYGDMRAIPPITENDSLTPIEGNNHAHAAHIEIEGVKPIEPEASQSSMEQQPTSTSNSAPSLDNLGGNKSELDTTTTVENSITVVAPSVLPSESELISQPQNLQTAQQESIYPQGPNTISFSSGKDSNDGLNSGAINSTSNEHSTQRLLTEQLQVKPHTMQLQEMPAHRSADVFKLQVSNGSAIDQTNPVIPLGSRHYPHLKRVEGLMLMLSYVSMMEMSTTSKMPPSSLVERNLLQKRGP